MKQLKITQSVTARTQTIDDYLKDISRLDMISPEEEIELAERIQAGDEKAFQRLVEGNLRFAVSVAKQYQNRGLELSDLINEANLGLMKAAKRFDPTRGFKFISYAVWWIRQQILFALSDQGRMIRLPLNQIAIINKINQARTEFLQENEREPSNQELAELVDMDLRKLAESDLNNSKCMSLSFPIGEDKDETLIDVLPDTETKSTDKGLDDESLRKDITEVLAILPDRERSVIVLSFGLGCQAMTLDEIGENLELTRERVRQLRMRAIRKLSTPRIRSKLAQYLQ